MMPRTMHRSNNHERACTNTCFFKLVLACALVLAYSLPMVEAQSYVQVAVQATGADFTDFHTVASVIILIVTLPFYIGGFILVYNRRSKYPLSVRGPAAFLVMSLLFALHSVLGGVASILYAQGMPCPLFYLIQVIFLTSLYTILLAGGWVFVFHLEVSNFLSEMSWREEKSRLLAIIHDHEPVLTDAESLENPNKLAHLCIRIHDDMESSRVEDIPGYFFAINRQKMKCTFMTHVLTILLLLLAFVAVILAVFDPDKTMLGEELIRQGKLVDTEEDESLGNSFERIWTASQCLVSSLKVNLYYLILLAICVPVMLWIRRKIWVHDRSESKRLSDQKQLHATISALDDSELAQKLLDDLSLHTSSADNRQASSPIFVSGSSDTVSINQSTEQNLSVSTSSSSSSSSSSAESFDDVAKVKNEWNWVCLLNIITIVLYPFIVYFCPGWEIELMQLFYACIFYIVVMRPLHDTYRIQCKLNKFHQTRHLMDLQQDSCNSIVSPFSNRSKYVVVFHRNPKMGAKQDHIVNVISPKKQQMPITPPTSTSGSDSITPPPTPIYQHQRPYYDFKYIMKTPATFTKFVGFLRREFRSENALFFTEVREFEKACRSLEQAIPNWAIGFRHSFRREEAAAKILQRKRSLTNSQQSDNSPPTSSAALNSEIELLQIESKVNAIELLDNEPCDASVFGERTASSNANLRLPPLTLSNSFMDGSSMQDASVSDFIPSKPRDHVDAIPPLKLDESKQPHSAVAIPHSANNEEKGFDVNTVPIATLVTADCSVSLIPFSDTYSSRVESYFAFLHSEAVRLRSWALKIYVYYVAPAAMYEIDLPDRRRQQIGMIAKELKKWRPNGAQTMGRPTAFPLPPPVLLSNLFRPIQSIVFRRLEKECFPRFLLTRDFQQLLHMADAKERVIQQSLNAEPEYHDEHLRAHGQAAQAAAAAAAATASPPQEVVFSPHQPLLVCEEPTTTATPATLASAEPSTASGFSSAASSAVCASASPSVVIHTHHTSADPDMSLPPSPAEANRSLPPLSLPPLIQRTSSTSSSSATAAAAAAAASNHSTPSHRQQSVSPLSASVAPVIEIWAPETVLQI